MPDWYETIRRDGAMIMELAPEDGDGPARWCVLYKPPNGRRPVMVNFCPCCATPLTDAETARKTCDMIWPLPDAQPVTPVC